ncbi:MAG TPA: hypothetical protein VFJ17_04920 [Mycobacteriales bacterium]|jgi:uncharacterized protein YggT (Ycf19 family)|nr:hypothetical protein [Mycobacteriales bacterium]
MHSDWMVVRIVLSTLAAVVVWTLLIALLVSWISDHVHHRHAP